MIYPETFRYKRPTLSSLPAGENQIDATFHFVLFIERQYFNYTCYNGQKSGLAEKRERGKPAFKIKSKEKKKRTVRADATKQNQTRAEAYEINALEGILPKGPVNQMVSLGTGSNRQVKLRLLSVRITPSLPFLSEKVASFLAIKEISMIHAKDFRKHDGLCPRNRNPCWRRAGCLTLTSRPLISQMIVSAEV